MTAKIKHEEALDTWLEPYIGHSFEVMYKGHYQSKINFLDGRIEWILNYKLNFDE